MRFHDLGCRVQRWRRRVRRSDQRQGTIELAEHDSGPLREIHFARHKWPEGICCPLRAGSTRRSPIWKGRNLCWVINSGEISRGEKIPNPGPTQSRISPRTLWDTKKAASSVKVQAMANRWRGVQCSLFTLQSSEFGDLRSGIMHQGSVFRV